MKQCADPKYWDRRKGSGKGNKVEVKIINGRLDQIRVSLGNCYQQILLKGQMLTPGAIKDVFFGNDGEEANTLSRLFEYHNEQASQTLTWSTLKHYYVTQRYLQKFIEAKHRKRCILLQEINYKFVIDFEYFLRSHKPADHQKPLNNNGVMKHLIRLRKMTGLALRLDWMNNDPFKNYKMRHDKVDKAFLTAAELKKIEEKKFSVERLQIVKDVFVFCCYTGLAYVDVMNLTENNIIKGIDEEDWIKSCRQKTNIPINTPLLPTAQMILERYKDHYRSIKFDNLFPVFSNQKVNLKEIADLCGVRKKLTFNVARHTFATTVTLSNGVPIETVSKMLGHTKIATTQIYARVLEKKVSEDMAWLRGKLR